ncbi:MAG: hypothetical protein LH481_10625 [Burkholderiales bacterium]|nr:hypothetical protein [Burkholderiales bacterium]
MAIYAVAAGISQQTRHLKRHTTKDESQAPANTRGVATTICCYVRQQTVANGSVVQTGIKEKI